MPPPSGGSCIISVLTLIPDCGFPGSLQHGKVLTVDGTLYSRNASYTCNHGYKLMGNDTLTCQPTGFWAPEAPICNYIGL